MERSPRQRLTSATRFPHDRAARRAGDVEASGQAGRWGVFRDGHHPRVDPDDRRTDRRTDQ